MSVQIWQNPEFIRHARSELRPARAATAVLVILSVCTLIGLSCYSERQAMRASLERGAVEFGGRWAEGATSLRQDFARQVGLLICQWLISLQAGLLTLWSLIACAQSVSGERDRRTWDFQRATSLTPNQLMVGKLIGEPILAYFGVLCAFPFTIWAGLVGGLSIWAMGSTYIGIIAASLFFGLCGLWLSTLLETRSRGIGMIGALALFAGGLIVYETATSWFPGFAAVSPLIALRPVLGSTFEDSPLTFPTLFGREVPWLVMSLLLYGSFGFWLWLMLTRNLKRDYNEIRPLSRWQAVACAFFLNFVFYALLSLRTRTVSSDQVANFMVGTNGLILFTIGLATLTPPERLRVWWRERSEGVQGLFSENGLPWPWLVLSAVFAYALMISGLLIWRSALDFSPDSFEKAALQLFVMLVFITRDILFVQWCTLTRLRQPVVKAFLFICLYYAAAGVVSALAYAFSAAAGSSTLNVLTPIGAFDLHPIGRITVTLFAGIALQVGITTMIMLAISNRLGHPSLITAPSES